ncbi:hypothetical protein BWI96_06780 [Siphonobacter sp. SORGH_AS_0500]|uniref:MBL fold metallo-hydrolase n=1 Tax=Siphonobacter sp. SORGH_AS_0500 TaxID=1864824 RepID=UPI000CB0C394|nr:MBL fold metallo-hydrolase [Siphonobacter sp. SORGH_AS_0500]PKK37559.1 hypothetical protein BWI96_06780 [Siphonobacter sp. SORGH_AS_0500]
MNIDQIKLSRANTYLLRGDQNILVDTGNEGELNLINENLKRFDLTLSDISLIIHIHGHGDHCGSTAEIKLKYPHIKSAIHIADNHMCLEGKSDKTINVRLMSKILKPFVSKPFPICNNEILIDNDPRDYGLDAEIIHTPGHTNGSISLLFKDGSAIIGDVLMGGYLGGKFGSEKPNYHYYATNMDEVNKSIEKLLNLDLSNIYVGHGGPLSKNQVKKWYSRQKPNRQQGICNSAA